MTTIGTQILDRIRQEGPGKVFIPKDFLDFGSRDAADQALSRLAKSGAIERLGRGLYCYPATSQQLGISVRPDLEEIADALGRQTGSRLIPSGAMAANRLGLSSQVPAKPVFLSDGRTRRVRIGGMTIEIKHVSPKELPPGSRTSAMVFQALRHVGQAAIDDRVVVRLRQALSRDERRELLRDAQYTTDWIGALARRIAQDAPHPVNHG